MCKHMFLLPIFVDEAESILFHNSGVTVYNIEYL